MKKCLLIFLLLGITQSGLFAQFYPKDPIDSFTFDFGAIDTNLYLPDTAASPLWQIGKTHKPFFTTDTNGQMAIMTDTLDSYPVNADNWFVIKVPHRDNATLYIWHKYQTDTGNDGGVIEFSIDGGVTWLNVADSCMGIGWGEGLYAEGLYAPDDTTVYGLACFNGTSDTSRLTLIQFQDPPALKTTAGYGSCEWVVDTYYVRFRFVSDTTSDMLAGWMIDSVKVVYYSIGTGVANYLNYHSSIKVFPNPSHDGIFSVEVEKGQNELSIEVFDLLGREVWSGVDTKTIDLSGFPKGVYLYTIHNSAYIHRGKLQIE